MYCCESPINLGCINVCAPPSHFDLFTATQDVVYRVSVKFLNGEKHKDYPKVSGEMIRFIPIDFGELNENFTYTISVGVELASGGFELIQCYQISTTYSTT